MNESNDPSPKPETPPSPEVVPYYSPTRDKRRRSSGGAIALGFVAFWVVTIGFIILASQTNIEFETGFMLWIVLVIVLLTGAIVLGVQLEQWGFAKGLLAAILLTGALFGLLIAICARK